MRYLLASVMLLSTLLTSGCASMIAPFSSEPMDLNHGKRTLGAKIEDQAIETKTKVNLKRAGEPLANQHIVVVSYNRNVLLAGQVADQDLRTQAGQIAQRIRNVRHVHNELEVVGAGSGLARINDSWLTTKVKSRLAFAGEAPARRTKVVTENGVVYLMGLLTREEAAAIVSEVQKVYGVQKIVKVIEYIENP